VPFVLFISKHKANLSRIFIYHLVTILGTNFFFEAKTQAKYCEWFVLLRALFFVDVEIQKKKYYF
jgi:hypothetical protein